MKKNSPYFNDRTLEDARRACQEMSKKLSTAELVNRKQHRIIGLLWRGRKRYVDELGYIKALNASLLHQLELKDKEIAMLQANITNISKL